MCLGELGQAKAANDSKRTKCRGVLRTEGTGSKVVTPLRGEVAFWP